MKVSGAEAGSTRNDAIVACKTFDPFVRETGKVTEATPRTFQLDRFNMCSREAHLDYLHEPGCVSCIHHE